LLIAGRLAARQRCVVNIVDKTEDILRVLILEDEPTDAELAERKLREAGLAIQSRRVDRRETFLQALEEFNPGLVLCDFKLPGFDGLTAVKLVRERDPDLPVIMVTGALGDEAAIELVKAGARGPRRDRLLWYVRSGSKTELVPFSCDACCSRKRALTGDSGMSASPRWTSMAQLSAPGGASASRQQRTNLTPRASPSNFNIHSLRLEDQVERTAFALAMSSITASPER